MRFTEHLAGLLFPSSRDGVLPRYKLLRKSIGSVVLIPLMNCVNESQALAVERILIATLRPDCNGADWSHILQSKGVPLTPLKAGRKRPPRNLRLHTTDRNVSVWSQFHFSKSVEKANAVNSTPVAKKDSAKAELSSFVPLPARRYGSIIWLCRTCSYLWRCAYATVHCVLCYTKSESVVPCELAYLRSGQSAILCGGVVGLQTSLLRYAHSGSEGN